MSEVLADGETEIEIPFPFNSNMYYSLSTIPILTWE